MFDFKKRQCVLQFNKVTCMESCESVIGVCNLGVVFICFFLANAVNMG